MPDNAPIGFEIKKYFFDREAVLAATSRATRRVLSRFGAFVMSDARRSIRKRKSVSAPGQPPTNRTGLLKKFIYFGYDPKNRSVIIGPEGFTRRGVAEVPPLLEYGGTAIRWKRTARYQARPYMQPAFKKNLPKLPRLWQDSVIKTAR